MQLHEVLSQYAKPLNRGKLPEKLSASDFDLELKYHFLKIGSELFNQSLDQLTQ